MEMQTTLQPLMRIRMHKNPYSDKKVFNFASIAVQPYGSRLALKVQMLYRITWHHDSGNFDNPSDKPVEKSRMFSVNQFSVAVLRASTAPRIVISLSKEVDRNAGRNIVRTTQCLRLFLGSRGWVTMRRRRVEARRSLDGSTWCRCEYRSAADFFLWDLSWLVQTRCGNYYRAPIA